MRTSQQSKYAHSFQNTGKNSISKVSHSHQDLKGMEVVGNNKIMLPSKQKQSQGALALAKKGKITVKNQPYDRAARASGHQQPGSSKKGGKVVTGAQEHLKTEPGASAAGKENESRPQVDPFSSKNSLAAAAAQKKKHRHTNEAGPERNEYIFNKAKDATPSEDLLYSKKEKRKTLTHAENTMQKEKSIRSMMRDGPVDANRSDQPNTFRGKCKVVREQSEPNAQKFGAQSMSSNTRSLRGPRP